VEAGRPGGRAEHGVVQGRDVSGVGVGPGEGGLRGSLGGGAVGYDNRVRVDKVS
jgi:hypothetical protein